MLRFSPKQKDKRVLQDRCLQGRRGNLYHRTHKWLHKWIYSIKWEETQHSRKPKWSLRRNRTKNEEN